MNERSVNIKVSATDAASGPLDKVNKKLNELKSSFGRGSTLKELSEVFQGGGVVAGFSLLGNQLGNFARMTRESAEELLSGKTSSAEMVDRLARGLPIIGGFVTAGREFRALMDGSAAAAARITAEAKAADDALSRQIETQKRIQANQVSSAERVQQIQESDALAGLTGPALALAQARRNFVLTGRQIVKDAKEKTEASRLNFVQNTSISSQAAAEAQANLNLTGWEKWMIGYKHLTTEGKMREIAQEERGRQYAFDTANRNLATHRSLFSKETSGIEEGKRRELEANTQRLGSEVLAALINTAMEKAKSYFQNAFRGNRTSDVDKDLTGFFDFIEARHPRSGEADRLYEDNLTPAERFKKRAFDLGLLLQSGEIDPETARRAGIANRGDLLKAAMDGGDRGGSRQLPRYQAGANAASALAIAFREARDPKDDALLKLMREQAEENRKRHAEVMDVVKNLKIQMTIPGLKAR